MQLYTVEMRRTRRDGFGNFMCAGKSKENIKLYWTDWAAEADFPVVPPIESSAAAQSSHVSVVYYVIERQISDVCYHTVRLLGPVRRHQQHFQLGEDDQV